MRLQKPPGIGATGDLQKNKENDNRYKLITIGSFFLPTIKIVTRRYPNKTEKCLCHQSFGETLGIGSPQAEEEIKL